MMFLEKIKERFANKWAERLIKQAKEETQPSELIYLNKDIGTKDKLEWSYITTVNFDLRKVLTKRKVIVDVEGNEACKALGSNRQEETIVCKA